MLEFLRQSGVHVLDDEWRGCDEMRRTVGTESFCKEVVSIVCKTNRGAACSAHVESDSFWFSFVDNFAQGRGDLPSGRIQDFKEILQGFFRITYQRDSVQLVSAAIGTDKEISPANVGNWRCNVFGYGISMEFFVRDDPHVDLQLAHHRKKQCVETLLEPTFARDFLLAYGEKLGEC